MASQGDCLFLVAGRVAQWKDYRIAEKVRGELMQAGRKGEGQTVRRAG